MVVREKKETAFKLVEGLVTVTTINKNVEVDELRFILEAPNLEPLEVDSLDSEGYCTVTDPSSSASSQHQIRKPCNPVRDHLQR